MPKLTSPAELCSVVRCRTTSGEDPPHPAYQRNGEGNGWWVDLTGPDALGKFIRGLSDKYGDSAGVEVIISFDARNIIGLHSGEWEIEIYDDYRE